MRTLKLDRRCRFRKHNFTCTGKLRVVWNRMGGQWEYQQFFSAGQANRHSVCERTWLEGLHHSWKDKVATFVSECEPRVVRCIWSPHHGMCLCLPLVPPTAQSLASLFQREAHLCFRNRVLHFLLAAACFPSDAHHVAVFQLPGSWVHFVLCVCLCHGLCLCLVMRLMSRGSSPIYSVSPLAAHFFFCAHHHRPDDLLAPVRYMKQEMGTRRNNSIDKTGHCTPINNISLSEANCLPALFCKFYLKPKASIEWHKQARESRHLWLYIIWNVYKRYK